jgi:PqqD family protein of HPr-rel-A system
LQIVNRKLVVNESVVYAELDDEAVLLDVETGVYFGLNAIGTQIWNALQQGASPAEIVRQVLAEYEVEPPALQADVAEFLATLQARGLIREVAS